MTKSFTNEEKRKFCIELLNCDTSEGVTSLLKKYGFLNNNSAWKPLGGTLANFSIVGNQSSQAVSALVEKLVNCIDHVLIDNCMTKDKIDPRAPSAPRNMREAVSRYFEIPTGLLQDVDPTRRAELAQQIQMITTGVDNKDPCYTVVDCGEGQSPDKFDKTHLSLPGGQESTNKSGISFVQGIFNMGGYGPLRFCENPNYELIISRRDPRLLENNPNKRDAMWGFTLIRRREASQLRESSVFEYLAPDNLILAFESDSIPALPGSFPNSYVNPLKWGTCIKLYEYKIRPKALTTNAILDLNYELSRHFYEMAIPIRIIERRKKFSGHTFETTLAGMSVRLNDDRSKVLEEGFPSGDILKILGIGEIPVTIYAFKDNVDKNHWVGDKSIILTVNGQLHGVIPKSFFSRQKVDLAYIEDDLMIVLDCSKISVRSREDLFMASRDRLSGNEERYILESQLEDLLGSHAGLQALAKRRREDAVNKAIGNNKPLKEILSKLIKNTPSLADIFAPGLGIEKETGFEWIRTETPFKGNAFPEFFRLAGGVDKIIKQCPIGSYCIIKYETDVRNDYFIRNRDPGTIKLSNPEMMASINLWNGIATLKLRHPNEVKVGDKVIVKTEVTDRKQPKPFESMIEIEIVEQQKKKLSVKHSDKKDVTDYGREARETEEGKGNESDRRIPEPIPVYENDENWKRHIFTKTTGLKLIHQNDNFDAYVNMDNIYLKKELAINKKTDPDVIKNQFSTGLILNCMAIYYSLQNKNSQQNTTNNGNSKYAEDDIIKMVNEASDGIALAILPTINSLAAITKRLEVI